MRFMDCIGHDNSCEFYTSTVLVDIHCINAYKMFPLTMCFVYIDSF